MIVWPVSPKKVKCPTCNKDFGKKEKSIKCDACEEWFHSECQNIPDEHCVIFGQYKSVCWYCDQCNKNVARLWKAINNITVKQNKFDLELEKLKNKLKEINSEEEHLPKLDQDLVNLREDLEVVSDKIEETDTKVETAIEAKLIEGLESRVEGKVKILIGDVEESHEIDRRKGNLILHGVKEFHREKPEDDGREHDRQMTEEILRVGLQLDPSRHIEEVFRIGRYDEAKIKDGKIRPIRIKIKTVEGRSEMLKRAKDLKTNGFSKVFIAPDLTRRQQLMDKELREKLKEIKTEANDAEKSMFKIKAGKIVKNMTGKQEIIVYQPPQNPKP